jgi:GntR family transcriptional repressor for pyruvate dehydrogenase complex
MGRDGEEAPTLGLDRQRTVEQVAGYLRAQIHRGELGPGDRLPPERGLAQELGIGRVTLRSALALLQEEGYLAPKVGAKGGTFVTALSGPYSKWLERMRRNDGELSDILEFRIAVERRAAELAALKATKRNLQDMKRSIEALRGVVGRNDYRQADSAFHLAVGEASHSPKLLRSIAEGRGEFFAPVDQLIFVEQAEETWVQHKRIFDAIASGDAAAAGEAAMDHVESTRKAVLDLLRRSGRRANRRRLI